MYCNSVDTSLARRSIFELCNILNNFCIFFPVIFVVHLFVCFVYIDSIGSSFSFFKHYLAFYFLGSFSLIFIFDRQIYNCINLKGLNTILNLYYQCVRYWYMCKYQYANLLKYRWIYRCQLLYTGITGICNRVSI